jgi:hypothetical protein
MTQTYHRRALRSKMYWPCMSWWMMLPSIWHWTSKIGWGMGVLRKLMGLSDKVRPHTSKHSHPPTNLTSPMSNRRQHHSPRHTRPVHLTPESSSVISLSHINSRKPIRTGKRFSTWWSKRHISHAVLVVKLG